MFGVAANQDDPDMKEKELARKLYRAPEMLSKSAADRRAMPFHARQKGDIYSFGILLYELVGRAGPWGNVDITHEGTYPPLT